MYYQEMQVDGVANHTTLDEGLMSTVEEPKRIKAIIINLDTHEGNVVEGWIGNKRILAATDYIFDTQEETAGATAPFSAVKTGRLPIEEDIPAGSAFKIGITCGAAANNIYGTYEYEIIT